MRKIKTWTGSKPFLSVLLHSSASSVPGYSQILSLLMKASFVAMAGATLSKILS
jgi:hypothetical protein